MRFGRAYCIVDNPFYWDKNSEGGHDCGVWLLGCEAAGEDGKLVMLAFERACPKSGTEPRLKLRSFRVGHNKHQFYNNYRSSL